MWLWVLCLLFIPEAASSSAQIRLVPGSYHDSGPGGVRGRLEIFHNGQWGAICNKNWNWAAQNVACQQLGYIRAIHHRNHYQYNEGQALKVWLSDVRCHGNETSFMDCALGAWGDNQCPERSDAGIWCLTQPVRSAEAVGCFSDQKNDRSLKNLYSYLRHDIDWSNLRSMVEWCAEGAVAKGYRFFGVQFYGECWGEAGHNPRVLYKTPVPPGRKMKKFCPVGVGDEWHNMIYELAPWENRGCWTDKDQPRRTMTKLKNLRNQINWFNMLQTVRQCYNLAKAANYTYFSIQFYGECWASNDQGYTAYGPSSQCWNGVGKGWANNVYKMLW